MSKRKKQIKKLDALFGIAVFARDKGMCQFGSKNPSCGILGQAVHHVAYKRYLATRHELDNGLTLCHECHVPLAHGHPEAFEVWFKEKYPERWEAIQKIKHDVKIDLDMVEEKLKGVV